MNEKFRTVAEVAEEKSTVPSGEGGIGFASPNEKENGTFEDARAALSSDEQKKFHALAEKVVERVGGGGEVNDAIGDWSDGAENSLVVHSANGDPDNVCYQMSVLGKAANQKAVIAFSLAEDGSDSIYTFNTPASMVSVRATLDGFGLKYRTLEPQLDGGTRVYIFDQGRGLRDTLDQVGAHYETPIRVYRGTGAFIGGDTREAGRQAYDQIISAYESRCPDRVWKATQEELAGGLHKGSAGRGPGRVRDHRRASPSNK